MRQVFHGREVNLEQTGKREEYEERRGEGEEDEQEEETREKSTRRGFCYGAATFRRRHIHSDTLLVTPFSLFLRSPIEKQRFDTYDNRGNDITLIF